MADGVPDQANAGCIGPQGEMAGKTDGCAGCPNQKICASGEARKVDPAVAVVNEKLSQVKHKILVLSGKGGVGKTTFACQLSFTLAQQGHQVGLLDVDICGPSVPRVMGLSGQDVHKSAAGWSPVYVDDNLGVMSIGFMLPSPDDAVIWRGPKKNGLIKQFLTDVDWGELDFLVVDTPPGTSDEHLSIIQYLKECGVDGAVVVTTPQEVAMADVRKEINFCKKTGVPVLGVVENMSGLKVPVTALRFTDREGRERTQDVQVALKALEPALSSLMVESEVFPAFGGGPEAMAASFGVPYLGKIPLDPNLLRACDAGQSFVEHFPSSPAAAAFVDVVKRVTDQVGAGDGAA